MRRKDADRDLLKQRILMFFLFFKGMTFSSYFERNIRQIKIYILPFDNDRVLSYFPSMGK